MVSFFKARTHFEALNAVVKELRQDEKSGKYERLVLIVPDRYSFEAEQKILEGRAGTFDAEVLTFKRMAAAANRGIVITKQGAAARLALIIRQYSGELACFEGAAGKKGFAAAVLDTIGQFKSSAILPKDIGNVAGAAGKKLNDIAFLYREYERFLSDAQLVDSGALFFNLKQRLSQQDLSKTAFYVANFNSFTRQIANIVAVIGDRCAKLCVGIIHNPYNENVNNDEHTQMLEEMFPAAHSSFCDEGLDLAGLSDGLYAIRDSFCPQAQPMVHEARNLIGEILFVARDIARRVRQGYRYHEMGVVINQPAHDIVRRIFSSFGINYYLEKKLILKEHPLARLILDLFEQKNTGLKRGLFLRVLKNPFLGCEQQAVERLENIVIENALEYDRLLEPCGDEVAESARLVAAAHFEAAGRERKNAVEYQGWLNELIEAMPEIDEQRDCFATQVKEGVLDVVQQLAAVCADEPISAVEYAQMLDNALGNLSISIIPRGSDCVLMGEPEMFLSLGKRVLYCVGLNEGILPSVKSDLGIFSDYELLELKNAAGIDVQPYIRAVNREARNTLLQTIAASRELIFTYSQNSMDNQALKPSFFLSSITKLMENTLFSSQQQVEKQVFLADEEGFDQGFEQVAAFLGSKRGAEYFLRRSVCAYEERRLSYLPYAARLLLNDYQVLQHHDQNDWQLSGFELSKTAASQLESYFSCPYKHFLRYGLKYIERKDGELESKDTGLFLHRLIELWTKGEMDLGKVNGIFDSLLEQFPAYKQQDNQFFTQLLRAEALTVCAEILREQNSSKFKIAHTEAWFGDGGAFAPIVLRVGDKEVKVSGKIDRVDKTQLEDSPHQYVRVIDYKTGYDVKMSAKDVHMGCKIQPFLYLSALKEEGEPAGAFYFKVHSGQLEDESDYRFIGSYVHSEEMASLMDTEFGAGEKSQSIPAKRNKDGALAQSTAALALNSCDELKQICKEVLSICEVAAGEIMDGYIEPKPVAGACKYCGAQSICYFKESARTPRSY